MSMLSSFFNVNKAMDIQPNLSKRKLKTPRNSAPRKVAKTAHLLNPPEDDPPKADVPLLEALENQPPLLEKLGTNLDNTLPFLEEMDIENPVLEGEPVLKDPPAADHVKLEDPPADDVKLEDPPAITSNWRILLPIPLNWILWHWILWHWKGTTLSW
ncbi:hypothetical protein TNCT_86451 [Trichonephila clavata]|uniref:Uncharacterized protein n=1 Tax=Trichonephila clavata TaxID=2740835 RepID=A0A8X6KS60_TRICU|nr:hypothetical protein TNCT_86451 [Trichonephila clavata]